MTSKEALSDLSFLAIGDENHTIKCKEIIEKDLDRLESLERENELLKKDLKEYQELYKRLEVLEILKAKVFHKMACFDLDSGWYDDSFFLDENELKIIKEWLENDK